MQIRIKLDDSKVKGVLKALNDGYSDFRPYLKEVWAIQLKSADESFKTRGANLGKPWDRLKTATVKQKIRIGQNVDILQRTGKLRKGFKISKLTKNELNIDNYVDYYKYHQLGTKNMKARQMLGHSTALVKMHTIAFVDYTLKLIQKWMK